MSEPRDDFRRYEDAYGLTQPKVGSSGNGILYTAESYLALKRLGKLTPYLREQCLMALRTCQVKDGLFRRHPAQFMADEEGPDDYVGLAAVSKSLDLPLAKEILAYGRNNPGHYTFLGILPIRLRYVYNNVTPGLVTRSSWLGRQQQLIGLLQIAAGETPNFLRILWLTATILLATRAKRGDHDSWILTDLALLTAWQSHGLIRWAGKKWWRKFMQTYPGGRRELYRDYFQDPDHPLARYG